MKNFICCLFLILGSLLYSCRPNFSETVAFDRGHEIYLAHCVSCHAIDGSGNAGSYPVLATRPINTNTTNQTISIIKNGTALMKPIPLDNTEIVDVVNYIQNAWGQKGELITLAQMEQLSTNQ